jgi:hypothetical protein
LQCSNFVPALKQNFAAAAMSAAGYGMQFVLPNRTPLPATREAGLVQIADTLDDTKKLASGEENWQ